MIVKTAKGDSSATVLLQRGPLEEKGDRNH